MHGVPVLVSVSKPLDFSFHSICSLMECCFIIEAQFLFSTFVLDYIFNQCNCIILPLRTRAILLAEH